MDWTFKNMKRLMNAGVYLFWLGVSWTILGLLTHDPYLWIGPSALCSGVMLMIVVLRAGRPADFSDHVDSEGREF